jgi:hypothetical protein
MYKYRLQKLVAYLVGALLYSIPSGLLRRLVGGFRGVKRGVVMPNLKGDSGACEAFRAEIARINYTAGKMKGYAIWANNADIEYFVLCGREEDSDESNAQAIIDCEKELGGLKKPMFYAIANEANDYSYNRLTISRLIVKNTLNYVPLIIKGAHTAIDESAALKLYLNFYPKNPKLLVLNQPHLVHFYLKYKDGSINSRFTNLLKKFLFVYSLFKLSRVGVSAKNIIVDEAHDGTKVLNGVEHGDYVFATKKGWNDLEKLCNKVGVKAVCYYQAPFLNYEGNTVL